MAISKGQIGSAVGKGKPLLMKLQTKHTAKRDVKSLDDVIKTLAGLGWRKNEDGFLILDNWPWGFAQVAHYRKGKYIAEWRVRFVKAYPSQGLARAQIKRQRGELLLTGKPQPWAFPLYRNDLLTLEDARDVLRAFWEKEGRPDRFYWRDLSKQLENLQKHKREEELKANRKELPAKSARKS